MQLLHLAVPVTEDTGGQASPSPCRVDVVEKEEGSQQVCRCIQPWPSVYVLPGKPTGAAQHRWGTCFRRAGKASARRSKLKAGQRLLVRFKLLTTGIRAFS